MKLFLFLFISGLFFISCNKSLSSDEIISPDDLAASVNMTTELSAMQLSLNNLISASDANQRHHWDSLYHHHDLLFWQHHNNYHHSTYTHDDHSHNWVPYDPNINHQNHYHHQYPNHTNDSLTVSYTHLTLPTICSV